MYEEIEFRLTTSLREFIRQTIEFLTIIDATCKTIMLNCMATALIHVQIKSTQNPARMYWKVS